jgi:hypothetical protein
MKVSCAIFVGSISKMLPRIIGGHLCLATLLQSNISPMQTDLAQLNQVILNLAVINRDAMPKVAV